MLVATAANLSPTAAKPAPGRVPSEFIMALKQHGMPCPIRGIEDPRLDYPDLLIVTGFERQEIDDGWAYRYVAAEDKGAHLKWEQYFEQHDDRTQMLVTRAGKTEQVITEDGDGRIRSAMRAAKDE